MLYPSPSRRFALDKAVVGLSLSDMHVDDVGRFSFSYDFQPSSVFLTINMKIIQINNNIKCLLYSSLEEVIVPYSSAITYRSSSN